MPNPKSPAHWLIEPSCVRGRIAIPSSKSQSLRALLLAALARGTSRLYGVLDSPDAHAMRVACEALGARYEEAEDHLIVHGIGGQVVGASNVIDAGNSGLVLRFIPAMAALGEQPIVVTGDHSIRENRPVHELLQALEQLGVHAESTRRNGYAPLIVQGPLHSGTVHLRGQDSQPVSALLMMAACAEGHFEIKVSQPGERPWVDLTLSWLERLGIDCSVDNYEHYVVNGRGGWDGFTYHVPGDLSSCAFPAAAAVLTGSELILDNVDMSDAQGDKRLFDVMQAMGAQILPLPEKRQVLIKPAGVLQGIDVDVNDFIDAVVILSVLAAYADGTTRIHNAAVARQKECDRLAAVTQELRKMGAEITENEDGLCIQGGGGLRGAQLNSHHDHRMAMSMAVAAFAAEGNSRVDNTLCVAKTYPRFVEDFRSLGAGIEEKRGIL